MILILIQRANSFRVNNDYIAMLTVHCGAGDWATPHPEALGAGVHRGAHSKTLVSIQKHPVQQIWLPGSIQPRHGDYCNGRF